MPLIRLRNINPLGAVFEHAVGVNRELAAGEEFDVDSADAGQAATDADPGFGLLGQLGTNYELVEDSTPPTPPTPPAAPVDPEPAPPATDPAPEG